MKTFVTDDKGNIKVKNLALLFIGMSLISYITSFNWLNQDSNKSIMKYIEQTNKSCPIEYSPNVYIDSVTYDGISEITQHFSARLIEMNTAEFDNFKLEYRKNMLDKTQKNEKFQGFMKENNIKLRQSFVNLNNEGQQFEIRLDGGNLNEINDH